MSKRKQPDQEKPCLELVAEFRELCGDPARYRNGQTRTVTGTDAKAGKHWEMRFVREISAAPYRLPCWRLVEATPGPIEQGLSWEWTQEVMSAHPLPPGYPTPKPALYPPGIPEPLPCPFCGGQDIYVGIAASSTYEARCLTCGGRSRPVDIGEGTPLVESGQVPLNSRGIDAMEDHRAFLEAYLVACSAIAVNEWNRRPE